MQVMAGARHLSSQVTEDFPFRSVSDTCPCNSKSIYYSAYVKTVRRPEAENPRRKKKSQYQRRVLSIQNPSSTGFIYRKSGAQNARIPFLDSKHVQ